MWGVWEGDRGTTCLGIWDDGVGGMERKCGRNGEKVWEVKREKGMTCGTGGTTGEGK